MSDIYEFHKKKFETNSSIIARLKPVFLWGLVYLSEIQPIYILTSLKTFVFIPFKLVFLGGFHQNLRSINSSSLHISIQYLFSTKFERC